MITSLHITSSLTHTWALSVDDLVRLIPSRTRTTIWNTITDMHKARVIHISGWQDPTRRVPGMRQQPAYSLGDFPDVERPPLVSPSEQLRRDARKASKYHSAPRVVRGQPPAVPVYPPPPPPESAAFRTRWADGGAYPGLGFGRFHAHIIN